MIALLTFTFTFTLRTQVSFSIDGDALNFERVNALITLRMDALALLNFTIVSITQGIILVNVLGVLTLWALATYVHDPKYILLCCKNQMGVHAWVLVLLFMQGHCQY